jgi:tripartite-type tricarboxylate transporter receptor subunit TctC
MELFKSMAGVDLVHVPYKGLALAFPDLISGQVAAMFDNLPGSLPHIRSGRLRALAVTSVRRSPHVPEVPTIIEAGLPGFDVTVWYAICAPAATPKPVLAKLNGDMSKALAATDLRRRFSDQGVDAGPSSTAHVSALVRSEIDRWAKVVRDAGIPSQ